MKTARWLNERTFFNCQPFSQIDPILPSYSLPPQGLEITLNELQFSDYGMELDF